MFWLSNCTGGPPNTWFVWSNRLEEVGENLLVEFKNGGRDDNEMAGESEEIP